ncbi:MAG: O-antigen ligase family protein [Acidobacteria bacterium]|nr:O-antigen ligase family protein [Acidobacteriota bacterium]
MSAEIVAAQTAPATTSLPPAPLQSLIFWGIIGLLLFGPLAFGAVEAWSLFVVQAGAAVLLALWTLSQGMSGRLKVRSNPLFVPLLLFGALVLWQAVSGASAYPYLTQIEAMKYATYVILFFLAVQTGASENWRRLATVLVWFGFLLAMFAIIQDLASNGKLYWLRAPSRGGAIYGPYVNRNHYAGLMEMLTPFALVAALSRSLPPERKALMAFVALIMGGSIFLSRSRGGLLTLLVQLLILAVIYFRRGASRRVIAALLTIGLSAGGFVLWLDKGKMVSRLQTMSEADMESVEGARLIVARDSLKMVADRPLTGWGLGAFPTVYPRYRSFYTNKFVNQAHNDYLQALVETGVAGFILVVWGIFALYREAFRKMRRGPLRSPILAAVVGCTGLLAHSFLDFNLRIPANATLFAVLCAAISTRSDPPPERDRFGETAVGGRGQ